MLVAGLTAAVLLSSMISSIPSAHGAEVSKGVNIDVESGDDVFDISGRYNANLWRIGWAGARDGAPNYEASGRRAGGRRSFPCHPFSFEGHVDPLPGFRCTMEVAYGGMPIPVIAGEGDDSGDTENIVPLRVTREDFASLPIEAGQVSVQPGRGWVLVNQPTVVWSDASPHVLTASVLGVAVEVLATPVAWAWDFGDGTPILRTTDPGAPWPEETVSHVYREAADRARISVETEWRGQFRRLGADGWQDVVGTVTTTSALDPIDVLTAEPRLITGDHRS